MIRNLKILGLALMAVFALGAVAASGASAQTVGKLTVNGGESATLDGTEIAGKPNLLTIPEGPKVECPGTVLTGHEVDVTIPEKKPVPKNASEVTITPDYPVNCTTIDGGGGKHRATVTMEGCDYDIYIGETITTNEYKTTADLTCPEGSAGVKVETYAFSGSELGGVQCTTTVKPVAGVVGAPLITDTTNDDLRIEGVYGPFHVTNVGTCLGAPETSTDGTLDVNVTVKGTDVNKNNTGITVTH